MTYMPRDGFSGNVPLVSFGELPLKKQIRHFLPGLVVHILKMFA